MSAIISQIGEYNSQRPQIILKEYGRNIQNIAEHIATLPSEEERLVKAKALISLMRQLNPKLKDSQDLEAKLWHHLHIVADNTLNIENSPESTAKHEVIPDKVPYSTGGISAKHFGKNIQKIAEESSKIEDEKEREDAIIYLARLMKRYYMAWNNERMEDEAILEQIDRLSKGKLTISLTKVKEENLFYVELKESSTHARSHSRANTNHSYRRQNSGGRNNNRGNDKRRRR